mgnify:FL=1|nr:MAG TPA: hypothetical protein [Caudoviricetes sp.]
MLTMEKTNEEMSKMRENQFFGEITHDENDKKECAMMGLIKNQIIVLEEELKIAKLKYADVALEKDNWSGRYEREMDCKVLEGKIAILTKMERDLMDMLTPGNMPPC